MISTDLRRFMRMLLPMVVAVVALAAAHGAEGESPQGGSVTLMVEAEAFEFHGDWLEAGGGHLSGGRMLATRPGTHVDAITVVDLPQSGRYVLWTRARDYATNKPGSRRFKLIVDGQGVDEESGDHGHEGWYWEKVGERQLVAGGHVLALHDVTAYSRCDAVLLTTGDLNPNQRPIKALAKFRTEPRSIEVDAGSQFPQAPKVEAANFNEAARLADDRIRLIFLEGKDASGQRRVIHQTQVKIDGQWRHVPMDPSGQALFLMYAPSMTLHVNTFFPTWYGERSHIQFQVNGKTYKSVVGRQNPFQAAMPQLLVPQSCRTIGNQAVEVTYRNMSSGRKATGRWHLEPEGGAVRFSLSFTADKAGDYSVGFCAFEPCGRDQVMWDLLPPMLQYQRLPDEARMVTSSITSQPLAMVQRKLPGFQGPLTFAVTADPAKLPFQWATPTNAQYGFTLLNAAGQVQPTIFSPVLGMPGSNLKAGQSKAVSWYVLVQPGDWTDALAYADQKIFDVTDYRRPVNVSLSSAALNMIDLIKDDKASGWDGDLKGFWNIESEGTVSQAAPLAVISAAMLTRDEQFYAKRALPTLEYTLSRPGAHFATQVPSIPDYVDKQDTQLHVPSLFFGTAYWQGVDQLLGRGANPWIEKIAVHDDGSVRYSRAYSNMPHWSELMGAYRLDPSPALLKQIQTEADAFLKTDVDGRKTKALGVKPFYNVRFYPYWWDLIDLYELTGEQRYLRGAEDGAFGTMAGLRVSPPVPDGEVTIHPGGVFKGNGDQILWRGDAPYRLGFPRTPGDMPEKRVPAWEVSQVGLGLEQPITYFSVDPDAPMRNIMMSCWAPNLLRVYEYTGRDIYRTFARNSIIGRFANYPGYYMRGFTDITLDPRYPYKGPDVTSIYYHHIPAQLAFTLDFLVTEARVRSQGKIHFPWVKQQGYAWFTNRIFGGGLGRVFKDDQVQLRLERRSVHVDSVNVNYLIGRGSNRLWLILMNDAHREAMPSIQIDAAANGLLTDQAYQVFSAKGELERTGRFAATLTEKVPAMGLIALSFPASEADVASSLPPVKNGHVTRKLDGAWGVLHAFRIRSPFRHDALYVVLTGRPAKGSRAKLILKEADAVTPDSTYPYEFSVYPWPMDKDMRFAVEGTGADGKEVKTDEIVLKGSQ